MAKRYVNPVITVNAVDLTDHVASVTINQKFDELDTTVFGTVGGKERIAGLQDNSLTIEFLQDYAAASVDVTIAALLGTQTTVVVTAGSGAVSATNPKYTMTCLLLEWTPIAGAAGDLQKVSVTWPVSGVVTRAVV